MRSSYDVVIVGGGVIGLALARELARRGAGRVAVLEKEARLGAHASGRNSGVVHAGLYYAESSLKAQLCRTGANLLKAFARERNVAMLTPGKVIVAADAREAEQISVLYERAARNGARVEIVDEQGLRNLEPSARTVGRALYSPDTALVDIHGILRALQQDATDAGVEVICSTRVEDIRPQERVLRIGAKAVAYGHLVNAAGAFADRLAHRFGVGRHYRLLPFRGQYRQLRASAARSIRRLIYPVPDLKLPFLGVHFTPTMDGRVLVGPSAFPAWGREHYGGFQGIDWAEAPRMAADLVKAVCGNGGGLWRHIRREVLRQYGPGRYLREARQLVPGLNRRDFVPYEKRGIRAQLFDVRAGAFVMDFVVQRGSHSTHILNAVSPGFTASFAFARYVADEFLGIPTGGAIDG